MREKNKYRQKALLKALYPLSDIEKEYDAFRKKRRKRTLLAVCAAAALSALVFAKTATEKTLTEDGRIPRNPPGGGDKTLVLEVDTDEGVWRKEYAVTVPEREYTQEELETLYTEAVRTLEESALAGNADADHVETPLSFPAKLSGYPFTFSWTSGDYGLLNDQGGFGEETPAEEGSPVVVRVKTTCGDFVREYETVFVRRQPSRTEEEKRAEAFARLTQNALSQDTQAEYAALPQRFEDKPVYWKETGKKTAAKLFFLGLIAAAFLYYGQDKDLEKRGKARDTELLRSYPAFINRLTLYMGAGLSLSSALFKIEREGGKSDEEKDYLHKELTYTCRALESGASVRTAVEEFGQRCRLPCYLKLSALLSQNMQKGGNELLGRLKEEAGSAFALRKNLARQAGEEASTKLLAPMLLTLCIVMVMILFPAFAGF